VRAIAVAIAIHVLTHSADHAIAARLLVLAARPRESPARFVR
jgi:hypothetical protein